MEDNSVVDKNGNILGRLMPDGFVINDDGSLIGVAERKKPETSTGVSVPAGTFGDCGAKATGNVSARNFGPVGAVASGCR